MLDQLAAEVTTLLAPFAPLLLEAGNEIADKVGDAAWNQARQLWSKIFSAGDAKSKLTPALQLVGADTNDPVYRAAFAKILLAVMNQHPQLASELAAGLKADRRVQEVLATQKGSVEDVRLRMSGHGQQRVEARGGTIKNVSLDLD
jgi:hypothetical protein